MVRPRFERLPVEQQQAIRRAALSEFAARGFVDASLNKIIETAGISKGSFYYYFDSKEDLYADVAREALAGLIAREGPFESAADAEDPEQFWASITDFYLRLMVALTNDPELASLVRGWIAAAGNPKLLQVQREIEQTAIPWLVGMLTAGQRIGAVRTDLPLELLLAVAMGMGQAMDVWLIGSRASAAESEPGRESSEADVLPFEQAVPALMGMIRRALQP